MRVVSIGSGSGGNCTLVHSESTRVLVDAGFGVRETQKRLLEIGESLESVSGIVITHEHSDHIHGAESIARKYGIPVWLTRGTLEAGRFRSASELPLNVFENNREFRIGDLLVHPRRIIHDAADPACFVLESTDGTRAGIASDLGWVDDATLRHLTNCDVLLFESNHDVDLLRQGSYPWSLKRRIMSRVGHLSNEDAMAAVERMIGPDTRELCLIHLSEKNNHDSLVQAMAGEMISRLGLDLRLTIAKQKEPGGVLEVRRASRPPAMQPPPPPPVRPAQLSLF